MPEAKILKQAIVAVSIAMLFSVQGFAARTQPGTKDQLQTELDSVNLQIDYLDLKVKENSGQIIRLENRISQRKKDILELEKQIDQLNEKQINLAGHIGKLEDEQKQAQKQLQELLKRFRARLVQLHKIKQGTLLGSIFSAANLNSFLNRFQMVKYLLENDKELLAELKKHSQHLKGLADELDLRQKQMGNMQQELDQKRAKVANENASLEAMLKTVVLEKKLFLKRQKSLQTSRNDLEKEITSIENNRTSGQKSFESELARPAPAPAPVESAKLPDSAPTAAKVMKFSWPAGIGSIKMASQSGNEKNPALRIQVNGEAEIIAAGRGKVLYKGEITGLGNVIILGHERGFSTVYANLDDMWVGLGQIVEQNETIGRIFGGERALHFEIRFGGKKQPPKTFLPPL